MPKPEDLEIAVGQSAILYDEEEDDSGTLCHTQDWDLRDLVLKPSLSTIDNMPSYRKALIFILATPYLLGFFADWKYFQKDAHHFRRPQRVLRRRVRRTQRIRLEGKITIRRRDGTSLSAQLYDFTPTGAGFYTDASGFRVGQMLLVEFDIVDCGTCETTATIARIENLIHSSHAYLIGVHFKLTEAQHRKAEQLYLCKKAEMIQQLADPVRHRWAPPNQ